MVCLASILLAGLLIPPLALVSAWNDPTNNQYHIQTDEGPERYFKYQTQNGQYRKEKRLQDGTVIGTYAWIDGNGFLRQRDYIADDQGYRIVKNKNLYVGNDVNIGDAMKAAKNVQNDYAGVKVNRVRNRGYVSITPKPIYAPSVEVSLNSIQSGYQPPSSTLSPPVTEVPSVYYASTTESSYLPPVSSTPQPPVVSYLPSSTPKPYVPASTPSPIYIPPSSTPPSVSYIPSSTPPPVVYLPSSTPSPVSYIPPSSTPPVVYLPSSTPSPVSYIPPSSTPEVYLPPSNVYIPASTPPPVSYPPPNVYLPPTSYVPPSSTPAPITYSTPSSISYIPPSSTPKVNYIPPSSTPEVSYLPPSSTPSSVYLPVSTPRPFALSVTSRPDYVNITPPSKKYVPQVINTNSIEYSGNPQYEHYDDNFVNPYIHQNGPTYPLDKNGHSFNPSYSNNIGNGYDAQYPYYDGISVTNDGFRYYIPRAYHEEQNTGYDRKTGSFGYIDPFGIRRVVYYNAGPDGFKHRKNNRYVGFDATPYDPRPY